MTVDDHVHLDRTFSPLHATHKDAEDYEIQAFVEGRGPTDWAGVENSHRAVIFAGAGIDPKEQIQTGVNVC